MKFQEVLIDRKEKMKKYIITFVLSLMLGMGVVCFADDGDISKIRVIPDATVMRLGSIRINFQNNTATINYREIDENGNFTGIIERKHFKNILDDPETLEDETDMNYNKMSRDIVEMIIERINAGDNKRQAIKKGVKSAWENK